MPALPDGVEWNDPPDARPTVLDVLLIHPPAVKPAEPPLGTAVLLRHLRSRGIAAGAIDANLEAYLHLLGRSGPAKGPPPNGQPPAAGRSAHRATPALDFLRTAAARDSFPRYVSAIGHIGHALSAHRGAGGRERLTLGDYVRDDLSAFAPKDLARLAEGRAGTLFSAYFRDVLLPRVEALSPRRIGISVHYRHQVLPAFELAGMLARRFPGVPLYGGGGMFGSWKATIRSLGIRFPPFSAIVFGPGEGPLSDPAAAGGYYLEDAACGPGFRPDYGFAPLADYLSPVPVIPVSASRGCHWRRCLFCPEAVSPTQPFSVMPPSAFADMLLDLSERHGARHFHLTDNAVPVEILEALAARSRELSGLSWHGFVRFEKGLLDPDLAHGLAKAGCSLLHLGLESGSQRVLDRLGKGTLLTEASAVLGRLKRAGIGSYVYVMLGTPGETEEDCEDTLRFIEAHADAIGFLNLAVMNLPRDSPLADAGGSHGVRDTSLIDASEPLGLYRTFTPAQGWGRAEARRFLGRRLLRSAAVRKIVARTPPGFTSHHAFLFRKDGDRS